MTTKTKTCTGCRESKPLEAFYKHQGGAEGRRSQCKLCMKDAARQRYADDPAAHIARVRAWQTTNMERFRINRRNSDANRRARKLGLDAMNTAAAATAAANVQHAGPEGSRKRGLYIGWAKVQLDRLMAHADSRHPQAAGWASEGYWQLVRFEGHRVAKLLSSVEDGRLDDVLEALIEYVALRKRLAAKAVLDAPADQQAEAMKDEDSADAEHYGY